MEKIGGIFAPVTTPFSEEGEILFDAFERNLEVYGKKGLRGLLVLGSNGEAPHLSSEEKVRVVEKAHEKRNSGQLLFVGVGFPSLRESLLFLEKIAGFRIDGILLSVPSYYKNKVSAIALAKYFSELADRSPFPVLLYNVPQFTGLEIPVEVAGELACHEKVVGMKDSSGNLIYLQRVLEATGDKDFQVLLGSAQVFGPSLSLGVTAGILAVACALPELPLAVLEAHNQGRDFGSLQRSLFTLAMALTSQFGIPGLKHAMDCMGFEGRFCRSPLLPLTEEEQKQVEAVLNRAAGDLSRAGS